MVAQMPDPQEVAALRGLVEGFIQERLQLKLDKIKDDDKEAAAAKRLELQQAHAREVWLADAAKRIKKIQLITHSLKGIHSAARGTSIYLSDSVVQEAVLVGTHVLKTNRSDDVASDSGAAFLGKDATDAVELLKRELNGTSLLTRLKRRDATVLKALTDDFNVSQSWAEIFSKVTDGPSEITSHTLAKQLYFPMQEGDYHLLAPLFPSSLVHHVYKAIKESGYRTGKSQKESKETHVANYRDFPGTAVRYLGGANTINVSVLNNRRFESERGGANHLLASLPPVWKDQGQKAPLRVASVFDMKQGSISRDYEIYQNAKKLKSYLEKKADTDNNKPIQNKRAELVQAIIDRVLDIATAVQCLPSGWSAQPTCTLSWAQKQWLDVDALAAAQEAHSQAQDSTLTSPQATEWRERVAEDFARWLNATISTPKTPMGQVEFVEWKHTFLEAL